jgi:hypothetical protein
VYGKGCNGYEHFNVPILPTEFRVEKEEEKLEVDKFSTRLVMNFSLEDPDDAWLTSVSVDLYRVDEEGIPTDKAWLGAHIATLEYIHDLRTTSPDIELDRDFTASVDLFEGTYRALVRATALERYPQQETITVLDTDSDTYINDTETATQWEVDDPPSVAIHPYHTGVFTIGDGTQAGSGENGRRKDIDIQLNAIQETAELRVNDTGEIEIEGLPVTIFDCRTGWIINEIPELDGGLSGDPINTGNFVDVVAVVDDGARSGGVRMDISSPTATETVNQRYISGKVEPAGAVISGTLVKFRQIFEGCSQSIMTSSSTILSGIGMAVEPIFDSADPDRGEFADEIIYGSNNPGGSEYQLWVDGLNNYWHLTSQTVSVPNDGTVDWQSIQVEPGGTLQGTVSYAIGHAGVEFVYVSAMSEYGGGPYGAMTDEDGHYLFELPAGEVVIAVQWIGDTSDPDNVPAISGALNDGTTVTVGGFTTRDFVQGPWSGEVLTIEEDAIEDTTIFGTTVEVTDNDGKYTAKFFEGINWVCINPNTSDNATYEFKCFYDIEVTPTDF